MPSGSAALVGGSDSDFVPGTGQAGNQNFYLFGRYSPAIAVFTAPFQPGRIYFLRFRLHFLSAPRQIQRQQTLQYRRILQVGRPAAGRGYGGVQRQVRVVQAAGAARRIMQCALP